MLLEICTNSIQSAINAQNAGAHRIELCSELSVGGITPSFGLIKQVVNAISIPVNVLIRPRSGDFMYSEDEFDIMKANIEICKSLGCAGIVSGVLKEDNTIDMERTKELIELSRPLAFTFHRAFDCLKKPVEALEQLISLKVDRVLTSGLEATAQKGIHLLKMLQDKASDKIIILPGSGINATNTFVFKQAGFKEIHASASKIIQSNKKEYDSFSKEIQTVSDIQNIKAILKNMEH